MRELNPVSAVLLLCTIISVNNRLQVYATDDQQLHDEVAGFDPLPLLHGICGYIHAGGRIPGRFARIIAPLLKTISGHIPTSPTTRNGCPDGFFMSDGSKQCFKIFTDVKRNWEEAKKKCEAEGLLLAKPSGSVAVTIRKHILDTHGEGIEVWLDARGDGSKYVWQQDGKELSNDNPLWFPDAPGNGTTTEFCLRLLVWDRWWNDFPAHPYATYYCRYNIYALCEGCPDGFFMSDGSKQCFKIFTDVKRNWEEAKKKCEAEGLLLAKPSGSVAVTIRKHILDTHGEGIEVWLDARGDGSKYVWQRDGKELSNDNPLWFPDAPGNGTTTEYCLRLLVWDRWWNDFPAHPYATYYCRYNIYALCEVM